MTPTYPTREEQPRQQHKQDLKQMSETQKTEEVLTEEQVREMRRLLEAVPDGEWIVEVDRRDDLDEPYIAGFNIVTESETVVGLEGLMGDQADVARFIALAKNALTALLNMVERPVPSFEGLRERVQEMFNLAVSIGEDAQASAFKTVLGMIVCEEGNPRETTKASPSLPPASFDGLREMVRAAYREGWMDAWVDHDVDDEWQKSDAKTALESWPAETTKASGEGWQGMESAPRDGTYVLVCRRCSSLPSVEAFHGHGWGLYQQDRVEPDGWMPLPAPLAREHTQEEC